MLYRDPSLGNLESFKKPQHFSPFLDQVLEHDFRTKNEHRERLE